MKKNEFLIIISVLTLVVAVLGATFSFFRVMTQSSDVAFVEAANLSINLDVIPLYQHNNLIPLDNDRVIEAFNNECLDARGNSACTAYTIKITNNGQNMDYIGNIKFKLDQITNLNYIVLNEDNTIYNDITSIVSDTDQALGEKFNLIDGVNKTFKLVIWLPNLDYIQDYEDGSGNFTASVTYSAATGSKVTGTFGH